MWPVGLREVIQSVRAWARWLRRLPRISRPVSNPPAAPRQRQPNTREHQGGREGAEEAVSSPEANPPDEPADGFSAEGGSGGQAPETGADNETPTGQSDQPVLDDSEAAKPDVTDGGHEALPNPNPPIPPEDPPEKSESASTQPDEGHHRCASRGDTEAGDPSGSDSTVVLPKPPKRTKPSRDGIPDESSNSQGSEAEEGDSKSEAPHVRGGKRTGTSPRSEPRPQQPTSRPELICRKYDSKWEVVISANVGCQIKEVRHNGGSLDMKDGEYRLRSFAGFLSVSYKDGKHIEFPLFNEKPLIFKLRADWKGAGRQVQ